jgi:hypothetical protein
MAQHQRRACGAVRGCHQVQQRCAHILGGGSSTGVASSAAKGRHAPTCIVANANHNNYRVTGSCCLVMNARATQGPFPPSCSSPVCPCCATSGASVTCWLQSPTPCPCSLSGQASHVCHRQPMQCGQQVSRPTLHPTVDWCATCRVTARQQGAWLQRIHGCNQTTLCLDRKLASRSNRSVAYPT